MAESEQSYGRYLDEALAQNFPELEAYFAAKAAGPEAEAQYVNGVVPSSPSPVPATNGVL